MSIERRMPGDTCTALGFISFSPLSPGAFWPQPKTQWTVGLKVDIIMSSWMDTTLKLRAP